VLGFNTSGTIGVLSVLAIVALVIGLPFVRLLFAVVGVAIGSLVLIGSIAEFQDGTLGDNFGGIVTLSLLAIAAFTIGLPVMMGRILKFIASAFAIIAVSFAVVVLLVIIFEPNHQATPYADSVVSNPFSFKGNFRTIAFSDTDEFYNNLYKGLKAKESLRISTNYTRYSQFPAHLKKLIKMDSNSQYYAMTSTVCPEGIDCVPVASKVVPGWLNTGALVDVCIGGFAAGGAALGYNMAGGSGNSAAFGGGIIGGVAGAGVGAVACNVTAAVASGDYEVHFNVASLIAIDLKPVIR
jgi:hypothetical protein